MTRDGSAARIVRPERAPEDDRHLAEDRARARASRSCARCRRTAWSTSILPDSTANSARSSAFVDGVLADRELDVRGRLGDARQRCRIGLREQRHGGELRRRDHRRNLSSAGPPTRQESADYPIIGGPSRGGCDPPPAPGGPGCRRRDRSGPRRSCRSRRCRSARSRARPATRCRADVAGLVGRVAHRDGPLDAALADRLAVDVEGDVAALGQAAAVVLELHAHLVRAGRERAVAPTKKCWMPKKL